MSHPLPYLAAADRPLPITVRPELIFQPQRYRQRKYWVVKDPVALKYHHLGEEEREILMMLDGRSSLAEIRGRFQSRFAPRRLSLSRLQSLLGVMHRRGLLLVHTAGQGSELLARHRRARRQRLASSFANVLAIRFRGVDPEWFLRIVEPRLRWLFSSWFLLLSLTFIVAGGLAAAIHIESLAARFPELRAVFGPQNLILLGCTLAFTKILHEFGHALTCKHFGGECHEIGPLLLVFTPALYCNVSDSWLLADKWQRMAITAAGIYVELLLATVCGFLWWASEPGLFNNVCFNVMALCSLSTILLNGNPLLRYDGYFLFADWLEIPNLWDRSRSLIRAWLSYWMTGLRRPVEELSPATTRRWLYAYGLASMVYRAFAIVAILFFLHYVLRPYRLEALAFAVAIVVAMGMISRPAYQAWSALKDPDVQQQLNRPRVAGTLLLMGAVLALVFLLPLPKRVPVPAVVELSGAESIYVTEPGVLVESVAPGEKVGAGQSVAILESRPLQREVARLEGRVRQTTLQSHNLAVLRATAAPGIAAEVARHIPATEEILEDQRKQLSQRRRALSSLRLSSRQPGTVIAPPSDTARPDDDSQLQTWTGSPLDAVNRQCFLPKGTLVCWVGDPAEVRLALYIEQDEIESVRPGQRVRVALEQRDGAIVSGVIQQIAKIDAQFVPPQLGDRISRTESGRAAGALFEARVSLDTSVSDLVIGGCGLARIAVDAEPLGTRLWRFLNRNFAFRL